MSVIETSNVYPTRVIDGCESAAVFFAAAFGGVQDAAFLVGRDIRVLCVDTDADRLSEMMAAYASEDWAFSDADAFTLAEKWPRDEPFDVVSLDPPTGEAMDRVCAEVDKFCAIAARALVVGSRRTSRIVAPDGWRITERLKRSNFVGGIYWTVLERQA